MCYVRALSEEIDATAGCPLTSISSIQHQLLCLFRARTDFLHIKSPRAGITQRTRPQNARKGARRIKFHHNARRTEAEGETPEETCSTRTPFQSACCPCTSAALRAAAARPGRRRARGRPPIPLLASLHQQHSVPRWPDPAGGTPEEGCPFRRRCLVAVQPAWRAAAGGGVVIC